MSSVVVARGGQNQKFKIIDISDVVVHMKSLSEEVAKHALRLVDEFTM